MACRPVLLLATLAALAAPVLGSEAGALPGRTRSAQASPAVAPTHGPVRLRNEAHADAEYVRAANDLVTIQTQLAEYRQKLQHGLPPSPSQEEAQHPSSSNHADGAAHDNWRRLAGLNDVVYDVGPDFGVTYAGTVGTSFNSGPLASFVSFVPSIAALPAASPSQPPPSPPPLPPTYNTGSGGVYGCVDPAAVNYNPAATVDDASCVTRVFGCMNPAAFNFVNTATEDDGTCVIEVRGCTIPMAPNFDSAANSDDGSCGDVPLPGCTDSTKLGYNYFADVDDGTCVTRAYGCMNPSSPNFDSAATVTVGTCRFLNSGCTDSTASNYESAAEAEHPDSQYACTYRREGCQTPNAWNFDASANFDPLQYTTTSCVPLRDARYGLTLPFAEQGGMKLVCLRKDCTNYPADTNCSLNGEYNNYWREYITPYITPGEDITPGVLALPTRDGNLTEAVSWLCGFAVPIIGAATFPTSPLFNPFTPNQLAANIPSSAEYTYVLALAACNLAGYDFPGHTSTSDPFGTCIDAALGCMDATALNFDSYATLHISNGCQDAIPGCMDSTSSLSYNSIYNVHRADECKFATYGCTHPEAANYNPAATQDDASCTKPLIHGCTESNALNYYSPAVSNDGTCVFLLEGCMHPNAINVDSYATQHVQSACVFPTYGCTDSTAINYYSFSNVQCDPTSSERPACPCAYMGCEDSTAVNYNSRANVFTLQDAKSLSMPNSADAALLSGLSQAFSIECIQVIQACLDSGASNYETDQNYVHEQTFCLYVGCMDTNGLNYDQSATNGGPCDQPVHGCMDSNADNFNSGAHVAASCSFSGCMDSNSPDFNPSADAPARCPVYFYGCMDTLAENYLPYATHHVQSQCEYYGCSDSASPSYQSRVTKAFDFHCCVQQHKACLDSRYDNYQIYAAYTSETAKDPCFPENLGPYPLLLHDDSKCTKYGCMDSNAANYDSFANFHVPMCVFPTCVDDATWCSGSYTNDGECDVLAVDASEPQ